MKVGAIGGVVIALAAGHAVAADWSFDPRLALSGTYNDNITLTNDPADEIAVSGAELDARL